MSDRRPDSPWSAPTPKPCGPAVLRLQANSEAFPDIPTAEDALDPARLRLSQDFEAVAAVKTLSRVPVRKPDRQWFFRTHPDPSFRLEALVLELKDQRETYVVLPELHSEVRAEAVPKILFTSINREGLVFLFPVRLPDADGRHDDWSRSAFLAAQQAANDWVRITSNLSLGAYEVWKAPAKLPEPDWPDRGFADLLNIAFRDRVIDSVDHPILRRLRGEL